MLMLDSYIKRGDTWDKTTQQSCRFDGSVFFGRHPKHSTLRGIKRVEMPEKCNRMDTVERFGIGELRCLMIPEWKKL